jgi:hypothetical protein
MYAVFIYLWEGEVRACVLPGRVIVQQVVVLRREEFPEKERKKKRKEQNRSEINKSYYIL